MTGTPVAVVQAAVAFGLDAGLLRRSLGGSSGSSWGVGEQVLRVGRRAVVDAELTASLAAAAAAVVPVPNILDRVELGDSSVVLLERLPGRPAAELARRQNAFSRVGHWHSQAARAAQFRFGPHRSFVVLVLAQAGDSHDSRRLLTR